MTYESGLHVLLFVAQLIHIYWMVKCIIEMNKTSIILKELNGNNSEEL